MTTLLTNEIKYQIYEELLIQLKKELQTDNEEHDDIMEKMILEDPSVFVSYGLLYYVVVNKIEIDIEILREVADEVWNQMLDNTFLADFQNYFLYLSAPTLK
jgi:hypothetical protein